MLVKFPLVPEQLCFFPPGGKSASPGGKVTRDDIRRRQEQDQRERDRARAAAAAASAGSSSHLDGDLEENLNRVSLSENAATNVDEAIQVLRCVCVREDIPNCPYFSMKFSVALLLRLENTWPSFANVAKIARTLV